MKCTLYIHVQNSNVIPESRQSRKVNVPGVPQSRQSREMNVLGVFENNIVPESALIHIVEGHLNRNIYPRKSKFFLFDETELLDIIFKCLSIYVDNCRTTRETRPSYIRIGRDGKTLKVRVTMDNMIGHVQSIYRLDVPEYQQIEEREKVPTVELVLRYESPNHFLKSAYPIRMDAGHFFDSY